MLTGILYFIIDTISGKRLSNHLLYSFIFVATNITILYITRSAFRVKLKKPLTVLKVIIAHYANFTALSLMGRIAPATTLGKIGHDTV
jgi:hypothetical protein